MKKFSLLIIIYFSLLTAGTNHNTKSKLRSLILPGWGEHTLGESKLAKAFLIREATLWICFISSKKNANWYRSDYIAFAELHADVDMSGKTYLFSVNLGHYDSLDEYNDNKERKRVPNAKYSGNEYYWAWDNKANRVKYDDMRIKSVNYDKSARFIVGGMILHRLISFIDVIYLEKQSISLDSKMFGDSNNIEMQLSINF